MVTKYSKVIDQMPWPLAAVALLGFVIFQTSLGSTLGNVGRVLYLGGGVASFVTAILSFMIAAVSQKHIRAIHKLNFVWGVLLGIPAMLLLFLILMYQAS